MAEEGSPAPDFAAPADSGRTIRLSDYRDRWGLVLFFYQKDGTPGCVAEVKEFQSLIKEFREADYEIVGVSCDSVLSHKNFKRECAADFWLLSDPNGMIAHKYGVRVREGRWQNRPARMSDRETFVIDRRGEVRKHYTQVEAQGHARQVLDDILAAAAQGS